MDERSAPITASSKVTGWKTCFTTDRPKPCPASATAHIHLIGKAAAALDRRCLADIHTVGARRGLKSLDIGGAEPEIIGPSFFDCRTVLGARPASSCSSDARVSIICFTFS